MLALAILLPSTVADGSDGEQLMLVFGVQESDPVPSRSRADQVLDALIRCGSPLEQGERERIATTITRIAGKHGYDPLFVQAIVEVESTCRPTARSHAGALGLIQVRPATARAVAKRVGMRWYGPQQLLRPEVNLELGVRYLAELEERFDDPYLAVAAYNLGPTRVAGMDPSRARGSRYVRKVLTRYESLLERHVATRS